MYVYHGVVNMHSVLCLLLVQSSSSEKVPLVELYV